MEHVAPLVLSDEGSAGPFVTGGLLRLPVDRVNDAVAALATIKGRLGVPASAHIHCRQLFAGDARRKTPFRAFKPADIHNLLTECVKKMLELDGSWWGAWANMQMYPRELQLVGGKPFAVTDKHLKGLVLSSALFNMEQHFADGQYRLAYDPDPTKIDWGLVQRTQATHFARIHSYVTVLPDTHKSLLDMADIAAYTLAQSLLANFETGNRKAKQFRKLLKLTAMQTAELFYKP